MDMHESIHNLRKLAFKRMLRRRMTPAERVLWEALRGKKLLETKWRRQSNVGQFIADFRCPAQKLIIEVDGGIHETQKEYDLLRSEVLRQNGYRILRFTNEEVLENLPRVLEQISKTIRS